MSKPSIRRARLAAYQRQVGSCFYCGLPMWLYVPHELTEPFGLEERQVSRLQCTAEHLIPRCEGGPDTQGNIVAACAHCNHSRHKRLRPPTPAIHFSRVQARMACGRWHCKTLVEQLLS